jgi:hypothetical protein
MMRKREQAKKDKRMKLHELNSSGGGGGVNGREWRKVVEPLAY